MSMKIGIVEGHWNHKENDISEHTTMRPIFDFLSTIRTGGSNGYHYHTAATRHEFRQALMNMAKTNAVTTVYFAMHGNEKKLGLSSGKAKSNTVTPTILKNELKNIDETKKASLTGLHFGTCRFCSEDLAKKIFAACSSVKWIAGYPSDAEFVCSSALDLMFFHMLIEARKVHKQRNEKRAISEVAAVLKASVPGLCAITSNSKLNSILDFSIFVRDSRSQGGVKNLLQIQGIEIQ